MALRIALLLVAATSKAAWAWPIQRPRLVRLAATAACAAATADNESEVLNTLPTELRKITEAFRQVNDDQLRYKQLLYMASQLEKPNESLYQEENRVLGCLSTVHVQARSADNKVYFTGDSDGLLTKGLVALLCRGLSGSTWTEIQGVDPTFIRIAGIATSLTPGRNNGFLNMLSKMKRQAKALAQSESGSNISDAVVSEPSKTASDAPLYNQMMERLTAEFNPVELKLVNTSHKDNDETHFQLWIVSEKFQGLNIIKRQKLIYQTVGNEIMSQLTALQIMQAIPPLEQSKSASVAETSTTQP
jgi:sulfur transfer protein SufE/stress-induced morphogen